MFNKNILTTEKILALTTSAADIEPYLSDLEGNVFGGKITNTPYQPNLTTELYFMPKSCFMYNKSDYYKIFISKSANWAVEKSLQVRMVLADAETKKKLKYVSPVELKKEPFSIMELTTFNSLYSDKAELKKMLSDTKRIIILTPTELLYQQVADISNQRMVKIAGIFKVNKFVNIQDTTSVQPYNFFTAEINQVIGIIGIHLTNNQSKNSVQIVKNETILQPAYLKDLTVALDSIFGKDLLDLGGASCSSIIPLGKYNFCCCSTDDWTEHKNYGAGIGFAGKGIIIVLGHEGKLNGDISKIKDNILTMMKTLKPSVVEADMIKIISAYSVAEDSQQLVDFVLEGGVLISGGHNWYAAQIGQDLSKWYANKLYGKLGFYASPNMTDCGKIGNPLLVKNYYNSYESIQNLIANIQKNSNLNFSNYLFFIGFDQMFNSENYKAELSVIVNVFKNLLTFYKNKLKGTQEVFIENRSQFSLASIAEKLWYYGGLDDVIISNIFEDNYISKYYYTKPQTFSYTLHKNCISGEWVSTGLFLIPGTRTKVVFSTDVGGCNFRIGSQSDGVSEDYPMYRPPYVVKSKYIPAGKTSDEITNFWGGIIYFIPDKNMTEKSVTITFSNVIRYFHLHEKSDTKDLMNLLSYGNKLPFFSEIEGGNYIATGATSCILENIKSEDYMKKRVAELKDMMDQYAWLRANDYSRPERVSLDWKISAGWMHSGYPIGGFLVSSKECFFAANTKAAVWGIYHEMGHNCQRGVWEFPPKTTESQCNIFSAFMLDYTGTGVKDGYYGNMDYSKRTFLSSQLTAWENIRKNKTVNFDDWGDQYPLATFLIPMTEFGWACGRRFFSYYYTKGNNWPSDWTLKQQVMIKHMSEACGKNLSEYYKYWGFDVSQDTARFCLTNWGLPWMFDKDKYMNVNSPKWNFEFTKN